jgi:hypothetical protein
MKTLFSHISTRITTTFLTGTLLLIALGVAAVMEGESNYILSKIAKAQVEEDEELTGEQQLV